MKKSKLLISLIGSTFLISSAAITSVVLTSCSDDTTNNSNSSNNTPQQSQIIDNNYKSNFVTTNISGLMKDSVELTGPEYITDNNMQYLIVQDKKTNELFLSFEYMTTTNDSWDGTIPKEVNIPQGSTYTYNGTAIDKLPVFGFGLNSTNATSSTRIKINTPSINFGNIKYMDYNGIIQIDTGDTITLTFPNTLEYIWNFPYNFESPRNGNSASIAITLDFSQSTKIYELIGNNNDLSLTNFAKPQLTLKLPPNIKTLSSKFGSATNNVSITCDNAQNTITFPTTLTSIGKDVFTNCTFPDNITIELPENCEYYKSSFNGNITIKGGKDLSNPNPGSGSTDAPAQPGDSSSPSTPSDGTQNPPAQPEPGAPSSPSTN